MIRNPFLEYNRSFINKPSMMGSRLSVHQGSDVNIYSETGSACKAENSKQMNVKQSQLAF